jgi:integrase
LAAAFEHANTNAPCRKCIRGIVPEGKPLTANPWTQFTWLVEELQRPVRQFDSEELLSLLDYLENDWGGVSVGALAAKDFLWSACRREEVAGLTWDRLRVVAGEYHFASVGKRSIDRWFRVPERLYRALEAIRTRSPLSPGRTKTAPGGGGAASPGHPYRSPYRPAIRGLTRRPKSLFP